MDFSRRGEQGQLLECGAAYFIDRWMEKLESFSVPCIFRFVETVDCQGFQLSRYAAELAEREGIDVGLIKRMLDLSPRERIEQSQQAADFVI